MSKQTYVLAVFFTNLLLAALLLMLQPPLVFWLSAFASAVLLELSMIDRVVYEEVNDGN